jgi:polyhydroxybutyrate depolymerase
MAAPPCVRYNRVMRLFFLLSSLWLTLMACSSSTGSSAEGEGEGEDQGNEGEGEGEGDPPIVGDVELDLGTRPATLVVPSGYDGSPMPLVLLLHGYTVTGPEMEQYTDFRNVAEDNNFMYVAPTGTLQNGATWWNAFFDGFGLVDDVRYLTEVVEAAQAAANVDPSQIFVVGHSNGAFMAHLLACRRADLFAGIVALAGPVQPDACAPTAPVAVLHAHGTNDETVLFGGGDIGGLPYVSAEATVDFWAGQNGCDAATDGDALDYVTNVAGAETTPTLHGGCNGNGAVLFWQMDNVSHVPFLSRAFFDDALSFLRAHAKPS